MWHDLSADDLKELVAAYKGVYAAEGTEFPEDPYEQARLMCVYTFVLAGDTFVLVGDDTMDMGKEQCVQFMDTDSDDAVSMECDE